MLLLKIKLVFLIPFDLHIYNEHVCTVIHKAVHVMAEINVILCTSQLFGREIHHRVINALTAVSSSLEKCFSFIKTTSSLRVKY